MNKIFIFLFDIKSELLQKNDRTDHFYLWLTKAYNFFTSLIDK